MGLFDTIKIDVDKLPILEDKKEQLKAVQVDWQTKDLEPNLSTYEITDDGKLLLIKSGWGEDNIDIPKEIDFHGILNFYGDVGKDWYEFYAKFTDGKLIEITGGLNNWG
ncbi:hypothetical protein [Bernardetia sp.]|uniref:hypothetical protein n=1 Tax=Bernardetia sp. TaxID=1937974 RepID=UPI0025BF05DE|nr:hypothetical protein [Bernardetia sp.]